MDAYKTMLDEKEKVVKTKDRWIKILFGVLMTIVAVIVFVLIYDITHPNMGYIQY